MLFDTHCHLNFSEFQKERLNILKQCRKEKINLIIVGIDIKSSRRAVDLAENNLGAWATIGLHPLYLKKINRQEILTLSELAKMEKVVAIGEVGLDYHHFDSRESRKSLEQKIVRQKKFLSEMIKIANENNLPVIFHSWGSDKEIEGIIGKRNSYSDILELIENQPVKKKGIVHSFIGSYKTAKQFTEKGFFIGLNGIITYSDSYDRLIKEVGLENIVLETDAPYLTPRPFNKNQKNTPCNVKTVARKIAQVLKVNIKTVYRKTFLNAKKIFSI